MSTLAATYGELGRHQDALALREKTLEFRRRVLPENDPEIGVMRLCLLVGRVLLMRSVLGSAMNELAASYSKLGQKKTPRCSGVGRKDS